MKIRIIIFCFTLLALSSQKLNACSGTGETALCNIIHKAGFVANGLIWIGEPTNNCVPYTSYSGNFEACQFLVKDVLYGDINISDTTFINSDSLIWVIGGPANLCYENANLLNGKHLFATRFQSHYAYNTTFKGYSTYAFNADRFAIKDTMVGNFVNDINYLYPDFNLGPDTILSGQLQNLVDHCISDVFVNEQEITVYQKNETNTFNILGNLTDYTIEVLDIDGTVIEDYTAEIGPLHINTNALPNGLYFVKVQHQNLPNVYVERILKN